MKKYLFALFLSFIFTINVSASEANISYQRLDGIYFNITVDGRFQSNHVTSFHLDDRIAYCIEPGTAINTKVYDVGVDWSLISFSDEVKEYIEKVGYYGYEYPGHQTDYFYIAAQELIWKAIKPDMEVVWSSGPDKGGNIIDVTNEKKEIENLVNMHSILPSFAFQNFSGYLGDEVTIEDYNGVLDYYDISSSIHHDIVRDGNTLRIKLSDSIVPLETIKLTRRYYDDAPLLVYSKGDSQKLAALRITLDKSASFTIENEEKPIENEVIEVPNTGVSFNIFSFMGLVLNEMF